MLAVTRARGVRCFCGAPGGWRWLLSIAQGRGGAGQHGGKAPARLLEPQKDWVLLLLLSYLHHAEHDGCKELGSLPSLSLFALASVLLEQFA